MFGCRHEPCKQKAGNPIYITAQSFRTKAFNLLVSHRLKTHNVKIGSKSLLKVEKSQRGCDKSRTVGGMNYTTYFIWSSPHLICFIKNRVLYDCFLFISSHSSFTCKKSKKDDINHKQIIPPSLDPNRRVHQASFTMDFIRVTRKHRG